MSRVKVDLGDRSYDIHVDSDNLSEVGELIKKEGSYDKVIIVTDPLVNDLFGNQVRASVRDAGLKVDTIEIPRGERYKTLAQASRIYDSLVELEAHRDSFILALGGGVIGDISGYVAATYMRGIDYGQVPTTLLAQVDASIGGKTGVDHPRGKNLIGAFYQPKFVFIDVRTITTLPDKELKTGLAEVIKYGVIEDDAFFKFLEANSHHLNTKAFEEEETLRAALKVWHTIVVESCKIKAKVVEKDERESGLRMILNYGHTIGHAIETLTKYEKYNHGEAVSIGMVCAANIANKIRMFDKESVDRVKDLLDKLGLPTMIERMRVKRIIKALSVDKKIRKGRMQFVLPTRIGKVDIKNNVSLKVVRKVLREVGCR
jgi:3-dehydroquinate synthase